MTAPADPIISIRALATEVGVNVQTLQRWNRAGYLPSAGRGATTLLGALQGIVRAVQAEAVETEPYEVKAPEIPPGHVLVADVVPALDRIAQAFDAALSDAVTATEAAASHLRRPPVSAASARQARQAEAVRASLYTARRRTAGLSNAALGLVAEWEARK